MRWGFAGVGFCGGVLRGWGFEAPQASLGGGGRSLVVVLRFVAVLSGPLLGWLLGWVSRLLWCWWVLGSVGGGGCSFGGGGGLVAAWWRWGWFCFVGVWRFQLGVFVFVGGFPEFVFRLPLVRFGLCARL